MPPGTIFGGYEAYAQCAGRATRPGGAKSLEGDGSETAREAFSRAGSKSVQIGEDRGSARGESRLQGTLGPVRAGGTRRVQRIRWPFHPPRTHGGIPADRDRWVRVREGALPHSDDGFVQAFPAETTEAVCDGHNAAFTSCRGRAEPWVVRARLLVDQALITLGLILRRGCGGLDRRLHLRARGTRPPAFEAVEGSSGRARAIGASQPRVSPGCMIVTA